MVAPRGESILPTRETRRRMVEDSKPSSPTANPVGHVGGPMSVLDGVVHAEGLQPPLLFRSLLVHPFVLAALLVSALSIGLVWLLGSSNPFTPDGYVGY